MTSDPASWVAWSTGCIPLSRWSMTGDTGWPRNSSGRMTNAIDALGNEIYYVYDDSGFNLLAKIDPLGNATYFEHDFRGNVTKQTHALANPTYFFYDAVGNRTRMTLANRDTCYYGYDNDNVGQLTREVRLDDQDQEVYTQYFTYDPRGRRVWRGN